MAPLPELNTDWTPVRMPAAAKRANLVILRSSDKSLHHQWDKNLGGEDRTWDLMLSHYGKSEPEDPDAEIIVKQGAFKYAACHRLFKDIAWLNDYRAVWFCDDDIMTSWADINRMFKIFNDNDMLLAQPSLTKNSYGWWKECFQQPGMYLRFTNFVEIMVPLFSAEALQKCLFSFHGKITGHGLDYLWPHLLGFPRTKVGMIDAVAVHHTRPAGTGPIYDEARQINVTPADEFHPIMKEYNLSEVHLEFGRVTAAPLPAVRTEAAATTYPILGDKLVKFFQNSLKPAHPEIWKNYPNGWNSITGWNGGVPVAYTTPILAPNDSNFRIGFTLEIQKAITGNQFELVRLGRKQSPYALSIKIDMTSATAYNLVFMLQNEQGANISIVSPQLNIGQPIKITFQTMLVLGWASMQLNDNPPLEMTIPSMALVGSDELVVGHADVTGTISMLNLAPGIV